MHPIGELTFINTIRRDFLMASLEANENGRHSSHQKGPWIKNNKTLENNVYKI
jgi:hypothetical protein